MNWFKKVLYHIKTAWSEASEFHKKMADFEKAMKNENVSFILKEGGEVMTEKTIEQRVNDLIVSQLGVGQEEVKPDANYYDDLGADSLDTAELLMALEEEFGREFPDEEVEEIKTVGETYTYIKLKLAERR